MHSGGHMQNEERGAEKQMDDYLKSIGLHRKRVAKDGSCLFRAVAEQVLHCQGLHTEVRAECVEFLKQNRGSYEAFIEGDFEDYLCKLQDPQRWVGEVEINALAVMYKRDFLIFQEPGKPPVSITANHFKDKVRLCFLNGNHYDSVYPISHIKNAALCQSILYEVLYDGVFKVDRNSLGVCHRVGRPTDLLSDDSMAPCISSDESDPDTGEPLWVENGTSTSSRHNSHSYRGRGRGRQLSDRARRSLNPTLLRNVEYDVWQKTKRAQQKMDFCMAAGMQFTVGDRCQVCLEGSGQSYNATIKEVPPNNDTVLVHIEELGKRHVPLWSLRPLSDDNTWSTVASRDKRLSNGCGDGEERVKGRGRGKTLPAFSAAAPGSSGRVQKQHSWPPQASGEDQGGAKHRKSVSSAETFGLTEQQRLAKEEEQRNVALVEIQLRDEQSFPALGTGTQSDGGRRRGGEKRRSQRSRMSPVEDTKAVSPSGGERPKSSTPPLTNTTSSGCSSHPAWLSSVKAPMSNTAHLTSPPTRAAPTEETNTQSTGQADVGRSTKPSVTGGAPPQSVPCSASAFSFITPVLPTASSPPCRPAHSSSPSASSDSPPAPTFIAPIAPPPITAQGLLPPPSAPSLPQLPSPPPTSPSPSSSSSPSPVQHTAPVGEVPPAPAQTPNSQSQKPVSQTQTQASVMQDDISTKPSPPGGASEMPQTQTCGQHLQLQAQVQSSNPPAGASCLHAPQLPESASGHAQPPVLHAHLHSQPLQPPYAAQLPPRPLCVSASPTHPSLQTHTAATQGQADAPRFPATPEPHQTHHPYFLSAPPPHHQSIPGAVPLQNLSQLYQDPLYPGFPQDEKGSVAPPPLFSSSASGDDLPREINILRFFFNLGVKAYTMPMFPPCIYLLPLQQAHAMHPKLSPPPNPTAPTRPPEAYPHYPQPHYGHQSPLPEHAHAHASEPPLSQAMFPVSQPSPHRMSCVSLPWQKHQTPPLTNSSCSLGYPSAPPPYPVAPPSSQGYPPPPGAGHLLYSSAMPPYPPPLLGYQPSSTPDELQASRGPTEQLQPPGGDTVSVLRPGQGPGLTEEGETRTVLLLDTPLSDTPVPVSMTTMKPSGTPGSPYGLIAKMVAVPSDVPHVRHGYAKQFNPSKSYMKPGAAGASRAGQLAPGPVAEALSVACSTEDDVEETDFNVRGSRRFRGGMRGRGGGYDRGRGGYRRRQGGEAYHHARFGPAPRGGLWQ